MNAEAVSFDGVTLVLDASAASGTVAILRDGAVVGEAEAVMRTGDRDFLLPAVHGALAQAGVSVASLKRVVCGSGPGSFTSLRIAGSIAKGIAHARNIPLLVVSSLGLAAAAVSRPAGRYVVSIDALRGEHYATVVTVGADGRVEVGSGFDLVASSELGRYAESHGAGLAGTPDAPERPHARGAARMRPAIVDLPAWEPTYGRLAEAQARWEAEHGRPLDAR